MEVEGLAAHGPAAGLRVLQLLLGVWLLLPVGGAMAQPGKDGPRPDTPAEAASLRSAEGQRAISLSLCALLSVAGTARSDHEPPLVGSPGAGFATLPANRAVRSELGLSPGVELHLDVPVHRHVGLGALVRVQSWRSEVIEARGDDDATSADLMLVPRARLPFALAHRVWVAYVQVPFGIGVDDLPRPEVIPEGMSTRPTLAAGLAAGLQALLFEDVGVLLGLDWSHRFVEQVIEDTHVMGDLVSIGIGPTNVRVSQLLFKVGVVVIP